MNNPRGSCTFQICLFQISNVEKWNLIKGLVDHRIWKQIQRKLVSTLNLEKQLILLRLFIVSDEVS